MKNQPVKISLFYCANSLSTLEINDCTKQLEDVKLNTISLPCSGKVNLLYLLKALETGSDAVILAGCKLGECKYIQGNLRAQKRIEAINDLLNEIDLGLECVRFVELSDFNKTEKIINGIIDIRKQIKTEQKKVTEKV